MTAFTQIEDLTHLVGPFTEENIVTCLQSRFYSQQYQVGVCVWGGGGHTDRGSNTPCGTFHRGEYSHVSTVQVLLPAVPGWCVCVWGGVQEGGAQIVDLTHLVGPFTEENIVTCLQSRFYSQQYQVGVCVCVCGGGGGVTQIEDLTHLVGPFTEENIVTCLQSRFYSQQYQVGVCVWGGGGGEITHRSDGTMKYSL